MSAAVLDGRVVASKITECSISSVEQLTRNGEQRTLYILSATTDASSTSYVQALLRQGARIGVRVSVERLDPGSGAEEVRSALTRASGDPSIHGIIVQTPLPPGVDLRDVADAIAVDKDVDGANPHSLSNWMSGGSGFAPATASAVIELLDQHGIELEGSRVTVVGRSSVVGKPLLHLFLNRDATVTVAHSKTRDLAAATRGASIVVAAAGRPGLITGEHVGEGAVVIDVGTNFTPEGHLTGDVDTGTVATKAAALSPVPGGIGSVTTALLFRNTVIGPTARPLLPLWAPSMKTPTIEPGTIPGSPLIR